MQPQTGSVGRYRANRDVDSTVGDQMGGARGFAKAESSVGRGRSTLLLGMRSGVNSGEPIVGAADATS